MKHWFELSQGEEVEERGVEGEVTNSECTNYSESCVMLEFYLNQEQNTGKRLILFSDVLSNNTLSKCKGP